MTSWEVTVVTESNFIKKVRIDDCVTRQDAEAAALGMTGGKRVITSTPKTYYDEETTEVVENNYYTTAVVGVQDDYDDEAYYGELDKLEYEMYDIMCQVALEEGRKLPTYEEFQEYLSSEVD